MNIDGGARLLIIHFTLTIIHSFLFAILRYGVCRVGVSQVAGLFQAQATGLPFVLQQLGQPQSIKCLTEFWIGLNGPPKVGG